MPTTVDTIHCFPGNPDMDTVGLIGKDTDAELTPDGIVLLDDLLVLNNYDYLFGITHARRTEDFEIDQKNYVGSEIKTDKESRAAYNIRTFPIPADNTPAWGGVWKEGDSTPDESGIALYRRLMETLRKDYLYIFGNRMVTKFNNIYPTYAIAVELMSAPETEILEEEGLYKNGSRHYRRRTPARRPGLLA